MGRFDIEKFPTSEAAKRMLRRVSPVYGNAYTAKWLYQVMGEEWDEARNIVLSLREQAFTQTVTWGIEYQEHKYSIVPNDNLSLEERRARLFRKKTKKHPANPWFYENYIRNGWGIESDVDELALGWGRLLVTILEDDDNCLRAMLKDLREKKQSHLVLQAAWRLIFGDDEDGIQETVDANDRQEGDFLADISLAYHDAIPYGTNIPILSRDSILRHGKKACHGGPFVRGGPGMKGQFPRMFLPFHHGWDDLSMDDFDFWPVWIGEEDIEAKEEFSRYFGLSLAITDKVEEVTGDLFLPLQLGFHELVPYGTEGSAHSRDGIQRHGRKAMRDGRLVRGGRGFHGMQAEMQHRRAGKRGLATERTVFAIGYGFEEAVKTEDSGCMSLSLSLPADDVPGTEEGEAGLEVAMFLRHDGSIRHDGKYARGMPLRASGKGFELVRESRNGKLCRGSGIAHRESPLQWQA